MEPLPVFESLTVSIFRGNQTARTFQVPLRFLRKCAFFLMCWILVTGISTAAAIHYYILAQRAALKEIKKDPEPENLPSTPPSLASLETAIKNNPNTSRSISSVLLPQTGQNGPPTQWAPPDWMQPYAPHAGPLNIQALQFAWLHHSQNPAAGALSSYNTLKIHFTIQYQKNDQGSQQGYIVLLAWGAPGLLTYPANLIRPPSQSSQGTLLAIERGEPFSVSHYRTVQAEFSPIRLQQEWTQVGVLLLDRTGELLAYAPIPLSKKMSNPANSEAATP